MAALGSAGGGGERRMPQMDLEGWDDLRAYARNVSWSLDEVWKQPEGSDPEQEVDALWRSAALEKLCGDVMDETQPFASGLFPLNRRLAPAEARYDVEAACRTVPQIMSRVFSEDELTVLRETAFSWEWGYSSVTSTREKAPGSVAKWHEWLWHTTQVRGESEPEYWLSDLRLASSRLASGLEVVLSLDQRDPS